MNFSLKKEYIDHYFVEFVDGKKYSEYQPDHYVRRNWHLIWREWELEQEIKRYCEYDSKYWESEYAKKEAFQKIKDFKISGRNKDCTAITQLLPFEIMLMNNGYKMDSFCELNAYHPGGFCGGREYSKDGKIILIGFRYGHMLFYFIDSKGNYREVINDKDEFEKILLTL